MTNHTPQQLADLLWKIYRRPNPQPWAKGSDLFWRDPVLARRILHEHLDESHAAASRPAAERLAQIEWLWGKLGLAPEAHLFDITCGPGLYAVEFARRGCTVTGIDFSPVSINHARELAASKNVTRRCTFVEQDILQMDYRGANFDGAILLYGQLAVFPPAQAQQILVDVAQALQPGARLALELLDQTQVDKENSSWWFTNDSGLWGDGPFLHLGERSWHPNQQVAVERYYIIHLESGQLTHVQMTDQSYAIDTLTDMLKTAGFARVDAYPAWDGLSLPDAKEWVVYLAERAE